MARIFTDGAESGDVSRWSGIGGNNPPVAYTSVKRSGNYSYQLAYPGSNVSWARKDIPAIGEFYARFAVQASALGATYNPILQWFTNGTLVGKLMLTSVSPNQLSVYDNTTLRGTSSNLTWANGEWHVIEIHVKLAGAGVGRFEVKFDGTLVIDFTGVTNTNGSTINQLTWCQFVNVWQYTYLDDIAVNDTSGGADNSWPGDGGVLAALVPTGAGNYSDLTASAGSPYACVDEIPVSITSTWGDYVTEAVADKKSTFALSDLAGLPAGASIARVWMEVAAGKMAADGSKIATLLRSGTHDEQGADQDITLALARYLSPEYLTDPQDSAAWTSTKVNALEAGAVVR